MSKKSHNKKSATKRYMLYFTLHKKLGLLACVFFLWIAVSGIALNHYEAFKLNDRYIQSELIHEAYGISMPEAVQIKVPGEHWMQVGDAVYVNQSLVLNTEATLLAYLPRETYDDVLVFDQFIVFWDSDEALVIEQVEQSWISPSLLRNAGEWQSELFIFDQADKTFHFNPDMLETTPENIKIPVRFGTVATPLKEVPEFALAKTGISYLQFVLDLHSGNFFGPVGRIVYDIFAVMLILMSLTGLWMYLFRRKAKKQKKRRKLP